MESKPLEIALAFTKAWTSHDLDTAKTLVADEVVFDGPMQQSTGIGPYFEGLSRLSESVQGVEIIAAFGDDEKALVMYGLLTGPFGRLTCAKCFTVVDGKIQKDLLTFDSYKIRSAK
jgi:hypothetical protein